MFKVGFGLIFTINAKNLDSGCPSFQTARLVNTKHEFSCVKYKYFLALVNMQHEL